jgi:site-specific DNA-adenine methylase
MMKEKMTPSPRLYKPRRNEVVFAVFWHFVCRHMQQQTRNKKGKESLVYLDPQMATRTNVHLNQKDVVAYFVKVMIHYKDDKEILVILFNMGNPMKFYQVRLGLVL